MSQPKVWVSIPKGICPEYPLTTKTLATLTSCFSRVRTMSISDKSKHKKTERKRTCSYIPATKLRGLNFVCCRDGGLYFERYGREMHLVANEPQRSWAQGQTEGGQRLAVLPVLLITDSTEALGAMTQLLSDEGLEVAGSDDPMLAVSILRNSGMSFQSVVLCLEDSASNEAMSNALLDIVEQARNPVVMMVREGSGAARVARSRVPTKNVIRMPASESDVMDTILRAPERADLRVAGLKL